MNTPTGLHAWQRIFLPYALGYYISYLLRTVNAVIAPDLSQELGLSAADLGLLTSAYLIAFALVQLPLGMALDRFGPRRVEAALLLLCAAGCAAFALGRNLSQLALARGLIGLGVSACLMAAFKAFSLWFPPERQAALSSSIMVAGGLGALTASAPFSFLLPLVGWRGIFWGLALLAVVAAWAVSRTPERESGATGEGLAAQLQGVARILACRHFWRFAPQTGMMIGGFIAIQSLWAVPWLMTVNDASQHHAAFHLLLLNLALMTGYILIASTITRCTRRGITPVHFITVGNTLALIVSLVLIVDAAPSVLLWTVFGLVFAAANLSYAAHAQGYSRHLSGRANTCLNLGVFVCGFALQWGFGLVVDAGQARGLDRDDALRLAWAMLLALQAASLVWFILGGRRQTLPVDMGA
ncbi:MFS transporter [Denitratisoma sp. agr-D3]